MPSHIDNTRQMLQAIRAQVGVLKLAWVDSYDMRGILEELASDVHVALQRLGDVAREEEI